jgi:NOL1/NOP2/fmu family ribosome biogenesis protein
VTADRSDEPDDATSPGSEQPENVGQRFDRLPATPDDREVPGRASRREVVDWWHDRFGVPPETFDGCTFWEKGKGKIWAFHGDIPDPIRVEGLGMAVLRTRQEHWKPTTNAVQRFGTHATRNVVDLDPAEAARFVAGEDQDLDWDGDWGYLIAAHEIAGEREPLGVGLFLYGELRSVVPKGRQESLEPR